MPIAIALAALLAASAAAPAARPEPLASRNPDGSWTLLRTVAAEPAPLAALTGGLAEDEDEDAPPSAAGARGPGRTPAAEAVDEDLRRAFEEALDQARGARPD